MGFGFFGFAMLAAFVFSYFITSDFNGLAILTVIAAGTAVFVVIMKNWRHGLYAVIVWLLFEDMVRKYLGNNMAIFFCQRFSCRYCLFVVLLGLQA